MENKTEDGKIKESAIIPMTEEEVAQALTTENQAIINGLYALTLSLYENERDRAKSIDGKAAAMFGFVGAFISAIFVVLGFLADSKNSKLATLLSGNLLFILVAVLVVLCVALTALFFAVAVKKGWRAPAERDLFEAIHKYDGHVPKSEANHGQPAHDCQRHLIEHFWKLYKICFLQNEQKAKALFFGQLFVFVGLFLLIVVQIIAMLGFHSNNMSAPKEPIAPSSTSPNQSPSKPASPPVERPSPLPVSSNGRPTYDGNSRPAPLAVSPKGRTMRESGDHSLSLGIASVGQNARFIADRPSAPLVSSMGSKFANDFNKKGK